MRIFAPKIFAKLKSKDSHLFDMSESFNIIKNLDNIKKAS